MEGETSDAEYVRAMIGDWLSGSLWPFINAQIVDVGSQFPTLAISATAGGLISWAITRKSDEKSRQAQLERDAYLREVQARRDRERNLFEYRHWRLTRLSGERKQWNLGVNTAPWYRYNWVLTATASFDERVKSVRFIVESMDPQKQPIELTDKFASQSRLNPLSGAEWIVDEAGNGRWVADPSEKPFFAFEIGEVIDNADRVVVDFQTDSTEFGFEEHFLSPFDTMKSYRPWDVVELDERGEMQAHLDLLDRPEKIARNAASSRSRFLGRGRRTRRQHLGRDNNN